MHIKSLAQQFPTLIHALVNASLSTTVLACAVSGRSGTLANALTKNADGTWSMNALGSVTGALTGVMPVVVAEKVYLGLFCIGGSTGAAGNPSATIGGSAAAQVNLAGPGPRLSTASMYVPTSHAPADGEISCSLMVGRNSITNREAYYKRWVSGAAALAFDDSYGNGIAAGTATAPVAGTVDNSSMACGLATSDTFKWFAVYFFALANMPTQGDLNACAQFMSASKGILWPGCAAWA